MDYEVGFLFAAGCGLIKVFYFLKLKNSALAINLEKIGFTLAWRNFNLIPMSSLKSKIYMELFLLLIFQLLMCTLGWVYVFFFILGMVKFHSKYVDFALDAKEAVWKLKSLNLSPDDSAKEFAKIQRNKSRERELYYYEIKKHMEEISKVKSA